MSRLESRQKRQKTSNPLRIPSPALVTRNFSMFYQLLFLLPTLTLAQQNYPDCLPGTEHPQWLISNYSLLVTEWWASPSDSPGNPDTVENITSTISFSLSSNIRNFNYTCITDGVSVAPPQLQYPAWPKCNAPEGAIPYSDEAKFNIGPEGRMNVSQKVMCYERNWPEPSLLTYKAYGNGSESAFSGPFDVKQNEVYNEEWEVNGEPYLVRYSLIGLLREITILANKIEVIV
ncbi:hypothetical protein P154DRAFT_570885 [Amniculicola lignicola CBS 123094]|uniref:Ig-like domain-containing protein n=1 Tax=Amniculicola lignicola CBS 123094 TaxID=1392246 RepID=A0A6A5WUW0_9PLEO|nr:hypothetical protein P154DRAFT_570885 [Amniculicola lignicola CBS 123094]